MEIYIVIILKNIYILRFTGMTEKGITTKIFYIHLSVIVIMNLTALSPDGFDDLFKVVLKQSERTETN